MFNRKQILKLVQGIFIDTEKRPALFWRILFYIILALLGALVIPQTIVAPLESFNPFLPRLLGALLSILGMLGVTFLFRRFIDKRTWSGMAFPAPSRASLRNWAGGFALGSLMIVIVFGIEYAAGWIHIVGYEINASGFLPSLKVLLGGFFIFLAVGIVEELMMRGYIFQNISERYPIWVAILASGVIFGMLHNGAGGFGSMFVASAIIITLFLIVTRLTTGTIWFAIGWHTAWNWWQTNVLGLSEVGSPDFGHALLHLTQNGPSQIVGVAPSIESGLLVILMELLAAVLLIILAFRAGHGINWHAKVDANGQISR